MSQPKWFQPPLLIAAGASMALVVLASPPPLIAFLIGAALVPLGAAIPWWRPAPADPRRGEPLRDAGSAPEPVEEQVFARALLEKLPTPLLVISRTGRIVFANSAAVAALPRLRLDTHYASVIRAPAFVEAVNATLADGGEHGARFVTHHDQERSFEARVALLPPGGGFGTETQAIAQIEDRTEARRAEQSRSDFIANASHELRTPLAAVIGYIETLQNHAREDPEARERFLRIMSREAGRMQRLVDDLMSLSRIEMTEHLRPVEEWSLNQIAAESGAALQPVAERERATLRVELEPFGAPVVGDRDQLAQVFANLIDNALKYGGPGSVARVFAASESRAHPSRYGVSIADDGPGIPREHLHRLTERFYRVNVSNSRDKGGTGLGLAIVKHILNRHGGKLEIASTPGAGSAFTVWLPRASGAGATLPDPPAEAESDAGANLRSA
ncbi:ATP-binding protein [Amaricoccus sp.]|uniref:sensor histidine kinase n=1 Tax=Amaricoccus sp. TaxID=1872485 RepID=UPI0026381C1F|nr:ATP-binding protein [uncultured Amaricoccus sp.]